MGLTVLFTHLKIILLQCFQFQQNKFYPNRSLEPKTHVSKSKIQNVCLVNYCHYALSKSSFSRYEGLSRFHIGPWSCIAKNAKKFEMLPLVIFSIIPKLPLFLF